MCVPWHLKSILIAYHGRCLTDRLLRVRYLCFRRFVLLHRRTRSPSGCLNVPHCSDIGHQDNRTVEVRQVRQSLRSRRVPGIFGKPLPVRVAPPAPTYEMPCDRPRRTAVRAILRVADDSLDRMSLPSLARSLYGSWLRSRLLQIHPGTFCA